MPREDPLCPYFQRGIDDAYRSLKSLHASEPEPEEVLESCLHNNSNYDYPPTLMQVKIRMGFLRRKHLSRRCKPQRSAAQLHLMQDPESDEESDYDSETGLPYPT